MRILCCHSELCQDRFIGINPEENDNGWVYYYRAGGKGGYMQEKKDIEELLKSGTSVGFYPQGNSMYPTIVPGRDNVIVEPLSERKIKRGDVLLFRRPDNAPVYPGKLILHRVCKVKEDGIYMVGDNEKIVEGPLPRNVFLGVMTELHRKGKTIKVSSLFYKMLTRSWLFLRPVRFVITKPLRLLRKSV